MVKADRLIVGHTRQKRINFACGGKVWRTDVSLSSVYGRNRPVQVLEIVGDRVRVLVEKRAKKRARAPGSIALLNRCWSEEPP